MGRICVRPINTTNIMGLWDFAWWIHRAHYAQIALIFFIFSREFALFAVDFGSTMRNPKEPTLL